MRLAYRWPTYSFQQALGVRHDTIQYSSFGMRKRQCSMQQQAQSSGDQLTCSSLKACSGRRSPSEPSDSQLPAWAFTMRMSAHPTLFSWSGKRSGPSSTSISFHWRWSSSTLASNQLPLAVVLQHSCKQCRPLQAASSSPQSTNKPYAWLVTLIRMYICQI